MPTKSGAKTIIREPAWLGPVVHPGEILLEEFLKPLGWTQLEAADRLGVSVNRLNEIVLGKRGTIGHISGVQVNRRPVLRPDTPPDDTAHRASLTDAHVGARRRPSRIGSPVSACLRRTVP